MLRLTRSPLLKLKHVDATTRSQSAQQGELFKSVTVITRLSDRCIEATRGNEKESVLYPLTKSRASIGASGQSEAYWDGEQLVTVTQRTVSGQTVTVKEARTLGPGGTDMTVETTVIVQHGYSMPGAKNYGNSMNVLTRSKP
jgi:hypothetical protein